MQSCKNSKSDFQMNHKIPSRTEVKSEGFSPYGIRLILNLSFNFQTQSNPVIDEFSKDEFERLVCCLTTKRSSRRRAEAPWPQLPGLRLFDLWWTRYRHARH